jgi:hypothetical protein
MAGKRCGARDGKTDHAGADHEDLHGFPPLLPLF